MIAFNLEIFIEILIITSILILVMLFILDNNNIICSIGINILLLLATIIMVRLFIPITLPLPITLTIPSPYIFTKINEYLSLRLFKNLPITLTLVLLVIWISVSVIKLIKFINNYHYYKQILWCHHLKTKNNSEYDKILGMLLEKYKIKNKISIVISDEFNHPFIVGFKDIIMGLPNKVYSNQEIYHIFNHELIHLINNDTYWKCAAELLTIMYWWNPFIFILKNQFQKLLEIRTDLNSIKSMNEKTEIEYLNCLLKEAKNNTKKNGSVFSLYLIPENQPLLKQRFSIIIDGRNNETKRKAFFPLLILIILIILSFIIFISPVTH